MKRKVNKIKADLRAALEHDPAAKNALEIVLTYNGFHALVLYRAAHFLHVRGFRLLARMISAFGRFATGIEIHPGARIGHGVFIDHGTGVVIGETTEIGNNVTIYQGATLGGTGKDTGKRHPTLENDVMVSAGAKVLGPLTVGAHSKIGAGSVVLKDVPPYSTVVGVPGRVVKQDGRRVADMDQVLLPDPILAEFLRINRRLQELEKSCGITDGGNMTVAEGEGAAEKAAEKAAIKEFEEAGEEDK